MFRPIGGTSTCGASQGLWADQGADQVFLCPTSSETVQAVNEAQIETR